MVSHKHKPTRPSPLLHSSTSNTVPFRREGSISRRRNGRYRPALPRARPFTSHRPNPILPFYRLPALTQMLVHTLPTIPEEDCCSTDYFGDNETSDSAAESNTNPEEVRPKISSAKALRVKWPAAPLVGTGSDPNPDKPESASTKSDAKKEECSTTESISSSGLATQNTTFNQNKSSSTSRLPSRFERFAASRTRRRNCNPAMMGIMNMTFEQIDKFTVRSMVYFKLS